MCAHAEREREREREGGGRERERERERENLNSKTLILKDSSVRSIWTYLIASPCYTTNTREREKDRQTETETDRQTDRDRQTESLPQKRKKKNVSERSDKSGCWKSGVPRVHRADWLITACPSDLGHNNVTITGVPVFGRTSDVTGDTLRNCDVVVVAVTWWFTPSQPLRSYQGETYSVITEWMLKMCTR